MRFFKKSFTVHLAKNSENCPLWTKTEQWICHLTNCNFFFENIFHKPDKNLSKSSKKEWIKPSNLIKIHQVVYYYFKVKEASCTELTLKSDQTIK